MNKMQEIIKDLEVDLHQIGFKGVSVYDAQFNLKRLQQELSKEHDAKAHEDTEIPPKDLIVVKCKNCKEGIASEYVGGQEQHYPCGYCNGFGWRIIEKALTKRKVKDPAKIGKISKETIRKAILKAKG